MGPADQPTFHVITSSAPWLQRALQNAFAKSRDDVAVIVVDWIRLAQAEAAANTCRHRARSVTFGTPSLTAQRNRGRRRARIRSKCGG